jgi:hypothetical protein
MNPLVIGSFILTVIGVIPALKELHQTIKRWNPNFDAYLEVLAENGKAAAQEYIKKEINFHEETTLIQDIGQCLVEGKIDAAKSNLSNLFRLPNTQLDQMLLDYENRLKNSGSMEVLLALGFQAAKQLSKIDQKIDSLNLQESNIKETLTSIIDLLWEIARNGKLKEALQRIDRINIDDLSSFPEFRGNLILIESHIVLCMEDEERYDLQNRKLSRIPSSSERHYFRLIFSRKLNSNFNIDTFVTEESPEGFIEDIRIINSLLENNNLELPDEEINNFRKEAKTRILKQFLANLINTNKPQRAIEIIQTFGDFLADKESELFALVGRLSLFYLEYPFEKITVSALGKFKALKDTLFSLAPYFVDYGPKFHASYYYNVAITLLRLENKDAFNYYEHFKSDKKLTFGFVNQCVFSGFGKEAVSLLDSSDFKGDPHFASEWIRAKYFIRELAEISSREFNVDALDGDAKIKLMLSRNITRFEEKGDEYQEGDLILFESERENVMVHILALRIFSRLNRDDLAQKYYELAKAQLNEMIQDEKYQMAMHAIELGYLEEAKNIWRTLDKEAPKTNILMSDILRIETNEFQTPSEEANSFFKEVSQSSNLPIELFRTKVEYLFNQGEKDRATVLQLWIAENYDEDDDWYQYALFLLDSRDINGAKQLIPNLQKREQTPVILMALAFLHLHTDSSKLESFGKYFFLAEKRSFEQGRRLSEHSLMPAWFYVMTTGLYDFSTPEYVKENVFVILKNRENNSELGVCIHGEEKYAVDFDSEYAGCKHVFIDDPLLRDLRRKSAVKVTYGEETERTLIEKEVPKEFIQKLAEVKNKEFRGVEQFHRELLEIVKAHSLDVKYVPVVINALNKVYEEASIGEGIYLIESIEPIWNYPFRYLNRKYYSNPDDYGIRKVHLQQDPLTAILPELEEIRQYNEKLLRDYEGGQIPFFIFAHKNYEHYLGGMLKLLGEKGNHYWAGVGVSADKSNKHIMTFDSFMILAMFDKLGHLTLNNLLISKSLLDEARRQLQQIDESIPNEHFSLSLEDDFSLRKYVTGPDANLERARKWDEFCGLLEHLETMDTLEIGDEFTPFVPLIGKLTVDSIRIASVLNVPIIIDDAFVQKIFGAGRTSNVLPFYFYQSKESIHDKLVFLNELSKLNYHFVLFEDLITNCMNHFLSDQGQLLFGESTAFGKFIILLKTELKMPQPPMVIWEVVKGLKVIMDKYLHPQAGQLFKELWSVLPNKMQKKLEFDLPFHFAEFQEQRNFVRGCLEEIKRDSLGQN